MKKTGIESLNKEVYTPLLCSMKMIIFRRTDIST
jgi:hypothetical protein